VKISVVNNFKLALVIVLLKVRKDVKLTTLGGRLFQATATRSLKKVHIHTAKLTYRTRIAGRRQVTVSFVN